MERFHEGDADDAQVSCDMDTDWDAPAYGADKSGLERDALGNRPDHCYALGIA